MTTIAQQTLLLFDTRGETAALRHILDQPQFLSRRQERERRFILNDGSTVSRNPETGAYTFSWPEGQERRLEQRQENPAVIFTYPSAHTVLHTMLLDIETQATPHGYEPPSRGDDPLITIKEAEAVCHGLPALLKAELDRFDPPDQLWEDLDNQVQIIAHHLAGSIEPDQLNRLTALAGERIAANQDRLQNRHNPAINRFPPAS